MGLYLLALYIRQTASKISAERAVQEVKKDLRRQVEEYQMRTPQTTRQHKVNNYSHYQHWSTPSEPFLNFRYIIKFTLLKTKSNGEKERGQRVFVKMVKK